MAQNGYRKFLNLTKQRWERIVVVQNVSPLVDKEELEAYFSRFGKIERIWFKHNPENGCFMKKALIIMKDRCSAADIIDKVHHRFSMDEDLSTETALDSLVTTVKYRGKVKMYTHGRFKLIVNLKVTIPQKSEDKRTKTGLYLIRTLVRAFQGLIFSSIELDTDARENYTGEAVLSFQNKCDEIVLKRIREQLNCRCRWENSEGVCDGVDSEEEGSDSSEDEEGYQNW